MKCLSLFNFSAFVILLSAILTLSISGNRENTLQIPLQLFKMEQYYGSLTFQNVTSNFIFDTGSNFIWIKDNTTTLCDNVSICSNLNTYFKKHLTYIKYGTGSVAISSVVSKLQMFRGINIKIGKCYYADKHTFATAPFDGIVGLGFPNNSIKGLDSLIQVLKSQGSFRNKIFSFYLKGSRPSLMFGELHPFFHMRNTFNFVPLVPNHKHLWKIPVKSITINQIDLCTYIKDPDGQCYAVIDSGTSYYSVPSNVMPLLKSSSLFDSLCINYSQMPQIIITLKNKLETFDLILDPDDYVTRSVYKINLQDINEEMEVMKCEFDFMTINSRIKALILGSKFMRKYYTVFDFDNKTVGFSKYEDSNEPNENPLTYSELLIKDSDVEIDNLILNWKGKNVYK